MIYHDISIDYKYLVDKLLGVIRSPALWHITYDTLPPKHWGTDSQHFGPTDIDLLCLSCTSDPVSVVHHG